MASPLSEISTGGLDVIDEYHKSQNKNKHLYVIHSEYIRSNIFEHSPFYIY